MQVNVQRIKPRAEIKSMFNGWALESKAIRRVRTPEGAKRFKLPIGSIIIARGPSAPNIDSLDADNGTVLKHIKIEESEYEGFDKVKTVKGRTLYIGKFPGEDEVTVNDEDDNELESFDSVEDAFAWADKHGDEAAFDDDDETRKTKLAKNEPKEPEKPKPAAKPKSKTKTPDAPEKPSGGDSGGLTDTGNTGKDFKVGDRVTSPVTGKQFVVTGKADKKGNVPVRQINDDGTDNPDGALRRIPARLLESAGDAPERKGPALKEGEKYAKTAVDSAGDPIVISPGGKTRYSYGTGNQSWTVVQEYADGQVAIRGDRSYTATAGGSTQTRTVDGSKLRRHQEQMSQEEQDTFIGEAVPGAKRGDMVKIGKGKAEYEIIAANPGGSLSLYDPKTGRNKSTTDFGKLTLTGNIADWRKPKPEDMSDDDLYDELKKLDDELLARNRSRDPKLGPGVPSARHSQLRKEADKRDQALEQEHADREAEDPDDPVGQNEVEPTTAGRYAAKVERNNEMIAQFTEAMQDDDRTEENKRGMYEIIESYRQQNQMLVRASKMDEDQGRLYMLSQGPPPSRRTEGEMKILDTYGKLIEGGFIEEALVLLKHHIDTGNGSYHIENTRNAVQKVVTARETAAHGGVPRPDRLRYTQAMRPVEARGFGATAESRDRMIREDRWTPEMERGYKKRQKYNDELAEWEKLAEKSGDPVTETKEGVPMGDLQYKAVPVGGVEEDEGNGVVTAIVAVTGIKDNVSDIIMPGAFQKSLSTRTPKGVWHHNITDSVSRTEEIKELAPGDPDLPETLPNGEPWPSEAGALKVKTRFNLKTQRGRDAYEDVKFFGTDQEWSIGYNVPTGGATIDKQQGVRKIKTLDLYEYSPVLFGAMPNARTQSVKSAQQTWKTICALDSDSEYDMEIKTLFDEVVRDQQQAALETKDGSKPPPPWLKDKIKKESRNGEDDDESQEDDDDDESSDDEGDDSPGGKFPFGKRKGKGKKAFSFDSDTIDRVDLAVKALADLRDHMVAEYKAAAVDEDEETEGDEDENPDDTESQENADDEGGEELDTSGEMATLVSEAGLDAAVQAAAGFDKAVADGDLDAAASFASDVLDAVEGASGDLSSDDALKGIVDKIAEVMAGEPANTDENDPTEHEGAPEGGDADAPPAGGGESKSIRIDPRSILDAIG